MTEDTWNACCCLAGAVLSVLAAARVFVLYGQLKMWSTGAIQPLRERLELSVHAPSTVASPVPSASRLVSNTRQTVHNLSVYSSQTTPISTERFIQSPGDTVDEYRPVDADTVLSERALIANRPNRSVRGVRVEAEHPYQGETHNTADSDEIRGLQAVLPVESVKRLHNPINTVFVCVVMIRAMQSLIQGASAVVTLAGAPYPSAETHCPAGTHLPAPFNETALPALVCDSSAMLVQFTETAGVTMLLLLLLVITSRKGARWCFSRPRALHCAILLASQAVAAGTAVGMWVFLPTLPSGSRFTASAAWCWIPTENEEVLRFACAYWIAPVITIAAVAAYVKINRLITRDAEWHFQRRCQVRETRHQRLALARRFVPLLVYYVLQSVVSGLSQSSVVYADNDVVRAVASFLYPVDAAVNSVMWAYAEGITGVLIMGDRAGVKPSSAIDVDDMQLPHVPFSLLVAEMYNLDFRSEDERRELVGRSDADWFMRSAHPPLGSHDDLSTISPAVTTSAVINNRQQAQLDSKAP